MSKPPAREASFFMKAIFLLLLAATAHGLLHAQELYVYTEPASNMPAHTLTPKASAVLDRQDGAWKQRYRPELMFGFSKRFMLHAANSFSNMYGSLRWESADLYAKYRFYSADEVHRHFRMALYAEGGYSRNPYRFDEVSTRGDRSGAGLGLIATQLVNKFALSATAGHVQAFGGGRKDPLRNGNRSYSALDYSLSTGYLLLPREYRNFRQLNMNLYLELLGQRSLDQKRGYLDLAPSLQWIFQSNSKLNLGYRFQLSGNEYRGMQRSLLLSFEHTFFNVMRNE